MTGIAEDYRRPSREASASSCEGLDPAEAGPAGLGSTLQLLFQIMDDLADIRVYFHPVLDQTTGVQDGAMVAPAERFANRVQRTLGELPRQEHGDLPWESDVFRPPFA